LTEHNVPCSEEKTVKSPEVSSQSSGGCFQVK